MSFILALTGCDLFESVIPEVPINVDLIDHPSDAAGDTVDPWDLPISVDGGSSFTSDPASADIGPLLFVDSLAREDGSDGLYTVSFADLTATGAPFTLHVSLGGDAVMSTAPGSAAPVSPPECAIGVDPASLDATAHAAAVLDCFHAWVDTNGAPTEPTATFSIDARAAGVSYGGTLHLLADERLEVGCEYGTTLPDEVLSNSKSYQVNDLRIGGYVGAVDHGVLAWGWVMVYDEASVLNAAVLGAFDLGGGEATYIGEEIAVNDPAAAGLAVAGTPVKPLYVPAADWNETAYAALLGADGSPGSADSCWASVHETVPNRVIVSWSLLGAAKPQL